MLRSASAEGFGGMESGPSYGGGFFSLGSSMEISAGPLRSSMLSSSSGSVSGIGGGAAAANVTYDLAEEEREEIYLPVKITYVAGHEPEQILFTAEQMQGTVGEEAMAVLPTADSVVLRTGEGVKLEQHLSSSSWIAQMKNSSGGGGGDAVAGDEGGKAGGLAGLDLDEASLLVDADDGLEEEAETETRREAELARAVARKQAKARRREAVEGQWRRVTALLRRQRETRAKQGLRQFTDAWRERTAYEYDEEDAELLAAVSGKADAIAAADTAANTDVLQEEEERLERFFSRSRGKLSTNSIHDIGLLDEKEMADVLADVKEPKVRKRKSLFKAHVEHFLEWKGQMSEGFNIILYGLGSKKRLIEKFAAEHLSRHVHLVVNGYFPSLSLKRLLLSLSEGLFRCTETPSDLIAHAALISELFGDLPESDTTEVFLVVHSLDGVALRTQKAQEILCQLAAQPRIHMIASVDHLCAPFLWDYYMAGKYNFVWYETSTYEHYSHETRYESSIFSRGTKGSLGIRAALMVLEGLPRKAHEVFRILASYQLKNSKGMVFQDLFRASREKFLVSRPNQLQAFLNEFREHKLIKLATNRREGTQQYVIMMPTAYIHKIVSDIQAGLHAASSSAATSESAS